MAPPVPVRSGGSESRLRLAGGAGKIPFVIPSSWAWRGILILGLGIAPDPAGAQPSWNPDIQPIVQRACQGCHTAGGVAPFSMESYADAAPHAAQIATMVERRAMPPWKADDACRPLQGSRRLPDDDVAKLVAWARGGAAEGPPTAPATAGPPIGLEWVDAELTMAQPYTPSTTRPDDYRCFVIDPSLPGERDLIGYDIVPGQRSLVHHVLLYGVPRAEALRLDAAEAGPGYTCFGGPGSGLGTVYGAWVPGTSATRYPEGTGITMATGDVIVMQIHYNTSHGADPTHPTHAIAPDLTAIKLQLSRDRVEKPALILPIADLNFTIPPKTSGYSTSVSFPMPTAAVLYGVGPHMHTRGRSIVVAADNTCLVNVPAWDFNWQQLYQFAEPLILRPGMRLKLSCTWDNATDKTIRWGEGTEDEMCLNYFYLTR